MYKKATPSAKATVGKIIEKYNRDGADRGNLGDMIVEALKNANKKEPLKVTVRPSDKRK